MKKRIESLISKLESCRREIDLLLNEKEGLIDVEITRMTKVVNVLIVEYLRLLEEKYLK